MGMEVATLTAPCRETDGSPLLLKGWTLFENLADAAAGADIIYTGPGAAFGGIDSAIAASGAQELLVLHKQPANRGGELSEQVFAEHAQEIYDQAENKLHVIKALLVKLLRQ